MPEIPRLPAVMATVWPGAIFFRGAEPQVRERPPGEDRALAAFETAVSAWPCGEVDTPHQQMIGCENSGDWAKDEDPFQKVCRCVSS